MKDMDLTALTQEWFTRKARSPGSEMKDFILEKHLERHKSDPKSPEEKADFMESLQKSWAEKTQEYDAALDAYPDDPTLEQWQAVEMLNNVMQEFAASPAERFRYLLNVKYLVSCQLAAGQSETEADALQSALQESYEAKWRTASNASEAELQELLSETVRLMQYAGVQYNRDTRRILAKIGAGQDAVFSTKRTCAFWRTFSLRRRFFPARTSPVPRRSGNFWQRKRCRSALRQPPRPAAERIRPARKAWRKVSSASCVPNRAQPFSPARRRFCWPRKRLCSRWKPLPPARSWRLA